MTLLYPAWLWLLLPLALLWYYRPGKLPDTVHIVILSLILLALARPVAKQKPVESEIEAREFIIALDVSYSMRAKDIEPSRYDYAKAAINHLLQSNQTDSIMLIAFTTNPLLLSPPTTDHTLISIALESLDPDNILTHGTSLKRLFEKIGELPTEEKNLILITDGGEENDLGELERIIRDSDIRLTILALGTSAGTTIKKEDGSLLKDSEGNLVVSRINPLLKKLAHTSGGDYIQAPSTPEAASEALMESLAKQKLQSNTINKMQNSALELYRIPLLLALILFVMLHTRAVKYLLLISVLWGSQLNASILDGYHLRQAYGQFRSGDYNRTAQTLKRIETPSLQRRLLKANTLYKEERYKKALLTYQSIRSRSPRIKQMLYYNIANCYAKMKSYKKAAQYYSKALQLGEDADALYNLKLVILRRDEEENRLAFARPNSQNSSPSSAAEAKEKSEEGSNKSEENSGGGSGGGGESKTQNKKRKNEKITLIQSESEEKQPLGSKVYDLINKGYIHEKEPW